MLPVLEGNSHPRIKGLLADYTALEALFPGAVEMSERATVSVDSHCLRSWQVELYLLGIHLSNPCVSA